MRMLRKQVVHVLLSPGHRGTATVLQGGCFVTSGTQTTAAVRLCLPAAESLTKDEAEDALDCTPGSKGEEDHAQGHQAVHKQRVPGLQHQDVVGDVVQTEG